MALQNQIKNKHLIVLIILKKKKVGTEFKIVYRLFLRMS